jgi:Ca2+-binding RTX toxin-like protein
VPYVLNGVKWGNAANGTAATVNWSFADNRSLDATLAGQYSGYTQFDGSISGSFRDIVRSTFALWDLLTGITFVEVADSASSQLRVGTDVIDGPGNTIGLATWYTNGAGSITQATIEFESEAFNDANIFYLIGLHELGHAIGLGHSSSSFDIMFPTVGSQVGLSIDDLTGGRVIYSNGLTLQGTAGAEPLNGGANDDIIFGFEGGDTINGNGGDDIIVGGRDSNDAADSLVGGAGGDAIYGNGGADTISDTSGNNVVIGGFGNDSVSLGSGNDIVYGNQNDDLINAGDGNNLVFAGQGNDSVITGSGADIIYGLEGNDTMAGGTGADRYEFGTGSGSDQVNGFNFSEGDRLSLQGQTFTTGPSGDGDVRLTLSGGGTIELNGIAPGAFSPSFVV